MVDALYSVRGLLLIWLETMACNWRQPRASQAVTVAAEASALGSEGPETLDTGESLTQLNWVRQETHPNFLRACLQRTAVLERLRAMTAATG